MIRATALQKAQATTSSVVCWAAEQLGGQRRVGADTAGDLLAEAPDEPGLLVEGLELARDGGSDLRVRHPIARATFSCSS